MQRPCQEENDSMPCASCREEQECVALDAGTCKQCSEEASETAEDLKREIDDLKAKVAFLSFWSPTGHHPHLGGRPHGAGFTDVVLVPAEDGPNGVPSVPVPAHRAILTRRSPIFKAMLENEMEESQSGTIKLSGMSYDAIQAFVGYLYAKACLDEQMVFELLVSAEKYDVKPLKAYCEKFLVSKLNLDNLIMYYAFAYQHNAKLLLEAALFLIIDNLDTVIERQEYSELAKKNPRLVLKFYEAWAANCKKNAAAAKDTSSK